MIDFDGIQPIDGDVATVRRIAMESTHRRNNEPSKNAIINFLPFFIDAW